MRIAGIVGNLLDFARSLAAALFASAAMAISVSLLPAFAHPVLGVGAFVLMAMTFLPIAIVAVSPVAICFLVVDACLRNSKTRFVALLLAGMGSGAASAAVLSTKLLPSGLPSSRFFWLIALGLTGGIIGACVFAYLTSGKSRRLQG